MTSRPSATGRMARSRETCEPTKRKRTNEMGVINWTEVTCLYLSDRALRISSTAPKCGQPAADSAVNCTTGTIRRIRKFYAQTFVDTMAYFFACQHCVVVRADQS
jgi:hypothetical protein